MSDCSSCEADLHKQVAADLRIALAAGGYRVGDRLPSERHLAAQYNVSRPTVRVAIVDLKTDGLVEVRRNSGVYVAALTPAREVAMESDVGGFEVLEARRLIEPQVAGLAAAQINPKQIAHLRDLMKQIAKSTLTEVEAADREFHLEIARATGNSSLVTTVATLWNTHSNSPQFRLLTEKVWPPGDRLRDCEYSRIVEAFAAQDASAARKAMWDHLTRGIESLLDATESEAIERARAEVEEKRRRIGGLLLFGP